MQSEAEKLAKQSEQLKANEQRFEELLREEPSLGETYGSMDCKRWEVEQTPGAIGSEETFDHLTARLKYRQQQHQVVVELINGKLKENYTRFVAGMNKINDVGECSEQTTLICDEGKSRLRFVKENLIANALALSEKHRRKQNLTHLRGLALQMKVIATLQQDTQRLLGERRYAEAAIAISKGLHKARSLEISEVKAVQQIIVKWNEERDRLFYKHLDKDMNESCKLFDATKYELTVQAISGMGTRYVEETAKTLPDKWRSVVGLVALASVMPYLSDSGQPAEAVARANLRQMMKLINSNNAALAVIQLLANLSYNAWSYNRMSVLLKARVKALSSSNLNEEGAYSLLETCKTLLHTLDTNRGSYFSGLQSKVSECFSSIQIHSVPLRSFFVLTFSFQMLCVLGKSFGEGVTGGLRDLVGKFQAKYLSEVMHKEACEITRIEVVFDHQELLTTPQLVEKLANYYDVSLSYAGDGASFKKQKPKANAQCEIPPQLLLRLILQKAATLLENDPSQNPFLLTLRNNTNVDSNQQKNAHLSALLSFFSADELDVVKQNMHTLNLTEKNSPTHAVPSSPLSPASPCILIRDGSVCIRDSLSESGAEVLLRLLRYEELLQSSESVGEGCGTQNTALVVSLLEQFVCFYCYLIVVNYCGVMGKGVQSAVSLQCYTQPIGGGGGGGGGGVIAATATKAGCPDLPTPVRTLENVPQTSIGFVVSFPEKDPKVPSGVRLTLEEMRQSALMVLKFKELCGKAALPEEKAEGEGADGRSSPVQSTSIENAFLAHYLRVQNAPLLKKMNTETDVFGVSERFSALDSAMRVLEALTQLSSTEKAARVAALKQTSHKVTEALKYMTKAFTKKIALQLFPVDGYPKVIAESKWERKTVEADPSSYVHTILKDMRKLSDKLSELTEEGHLSLQNVSLLWERVAEGLWAALTEGFSRVKKCTNEGRALMSLDLQSISHFLKSVSSGSIPSAEPVEEFVKAFYLDVDAYCEWVGAAHSKYSTKQLLSLCTINTGVLDRKRKDKQETQRKLEEMLKQLEHVDPI